MTNKKSQNQDDPLHLIRDVEAATKLAALTTVAPHAISLKYSEMQGTILTGLMLAAWTNHLAACLEIGNTPAQARKSFLRAAQQLTRP